MRHRRRYWRCDGVEGLPHWRNFPFVNTEAWLQQSLRKRGGGRFNLAADLSPKICLERETPDDHPLCAERRRNTTWCGAS